MARSPEVIGLMRTLRREVLLVMPHHLALAPIAPDVGRGGAGEGGNSRLVSPPTVLPAAVVATPPVVIMPVSRMILVEVLVQVPQRTVVGVVFRLAVEAFLMGTAVRFAQVAVEPPVLRVIAVVVMRQRRHHWRGEQ